MAKSATPRGYDRKRRPYWTDFECPECTAENPFDDGFFIGDEVFCYHCQSVFRVLSVPDADVPKYKLKLES